MSSLVFWQNIPSIHQASFVREVARLWSGDVWIAVESDISDFRVQQGWMCPDFAPARLLVAPDRKERIRLLEQTQSRDDVHVFSGLRAYPETYWTMTRACKTRALLGVIAEPGRHDDGWRALLRRGWYTLNCFFWKEKLDFLLSTGKIGFEWYMSCLFPGDKIFPFGYFVDTSSGSIDSKIYSENIFNILFVGQIIHRKGIDILLHALAGLHDLVWNLHIVGKGEQQEELNILAHDLDINDRIVWEGVFENAGVRRLMKEVDLLVLPSRFDGWGAVVNEALMAGTPVVVSDTCGASDLVRAPFLGTVFVSQSVVNLRDALRKEMDNGKLTSIQRQKIIKWSEKITTAASAAYFMNILASVRQGEGRPLPPWEQLDEES